METKRCPFCGEEIMEQAKKCRFCGEWLEEKILYGEQPQIETANLVHPHIIKENFINYNTAYVLCWVAIPFVLIGMGITSNKFQSEVPIVEGVLGIISAVILIILLLSIKTFSQNIREVNIPFNAAVFVIAAMALFAFFMCFFPLDHVSDDASIGAILVLFFLTVLFITFFCQIGSRLKNDYAPESNLTSLGKMLIIYAFLMPILATMIIIVEVEDKKLLTTICRIYAILELIMLWRFRIVLKHAGKYELTHLKQYVK